MINKLFEKLFSDAANLAELLGVTISKPQSALRSVYRPTAGDYTDNAQTYYRINFFFPTLDNVIGDIRLRFGSSQQQAAQLSRAVPYFMVFDAGNEEYDSEWKKLAKGAVMYSDFLLDPTATLKAEFQLWRKR